MTRIAMLATAAVIALANPAFAKLNPNSVNPNGLAANGLTNNGTAPNAVIAHAPPSDFCAQGKGDAVIAHAPPSDFCAQNVSQPVGLSLGGLDGMKVMSIELPR